MPELPTCICVRGLPPYDRLTAIYQAVAELSGSPELPDPLCVAGVPPFQRFSYIYEAFRDLAGGESLPSQLCVAGESPQDQVSRIYQAVALYADDASLPSYECVRGMPIWQQWIEIYRALYVAAGSPEGLVNPACVTIGNLDVLSDVFCVLVGSGGNATLLASFYIPEIVDSFERSIPAGYSGDGDPNPFQREAAVDVLRDEHYQVGLSPDGNFVILEDEPTQCALVAPGIALVTPGAAMYSATFAPIPVTVSLLRYEYRLDNFGAWTSNGTSTTITDAPAAGGTHVLNVRAVCTSGIAGDDSESAPFDVEGGTIALVDSVSAPSDGDETTTSAIDTTGANLIVVGIYWFTGAVFLDISDNKGNTYTPLPSYGSSLHAQLYYCVPTTVGAGHTFTIEGSSNFCGITVAAFESAGALDDETGATGTQPGTITPAGDGELFVAVWGRNDANTLTINSGFTIAQQTPYIPGQSVEVGLAYKIQTTGGAENPTTNSDDSVAMAAFLPA